MRRVRSNLALWCSLFSAFGCGGGAKEVSRSTLPGASEPALRFDDRRATQAEEDSLAREKEEQAVYLKEYQEKERARAEAERKAEEARVEANRSVGLTCYGKIVRYACEENPQDRGVFPVDGTGEKPANVSFCGTTTLYGCDDEEGKPIIPFIHRRNFGAGPFKFGASGFALAEEDYTVGRGGYVYINRDYTKRFEALTVEGVPDVWSMEHFGEGAAPLTIGRYRDSGKVGYLDLERGILTPPKFGSGLPFLGSDKPRTEVLVCEGCHPERWGSCPPQEALCTGRAYLIDRDGKRLKKPPGDEYPEYVWCTEHPGQRDFPEHLVFCQ